MAASIIRFDPFSSLSALRRELFDDGLDRVMRSPALPTTDVYTEDDKTLVVEAHLPNFREEDIAVNVDGGHLIIQAERREKEEKEEDKRRRYVIRESSSSFYRSLALPEKTQEDGISASFDKGLLTVRVPLAQTAEPRKIAIGAGS